MTVALPRLAALTLALTLVCGCQKPAKTKPDYNRPLPPGASALRLLLDTAQWPDLQEPFERKDADLIASLERSQSWFAAQSSRQFFPLGDVSHIRGQASVYAMRKLLAESGSASEFDAAMKEQFNCYTSIGYDDKGTVLFTGYFTPIFKGSATPTETYKYPLYKKPADLDIDPISGKVHGRKTGGGHSPYPTRSQLESSGELNGLELVYLPSRLDQYIIQVNGSAKIELAEGGVMYVGYAGTNGAEYTGLGATLLKEGVFQPEELNLAAIRQHFAGKGEDELERYINMNDRYVFFAHYDGGKWPAGSLGVKVTAKRSLATDKEIFPRGGPVVVNTSIPGGSFNQWMVDQDTGGAIRAAGRGDIYMGIGPEAERLAGGQFAEGRLYYFFLKHARVAEWMQRMREDPTGVKPAPEPTIPVEPALY